MSTSAARKAVPGTVKQVIGAAYPPLYQSSDSSKPASKSSSSSSLTSSKTSPQPQQPSPPTITKSASSSSTGTGSGSSKLEKFRKLLSAPNVNIEELRKLSWSGIPDELRPVAWRILLGYLPTNLDRREATLERKRKEYMDCVPQYFDNADKERDDYEKALLKQISIDVPRTNPSCALFQNDIIQKSLIKILYVWAIRHPASGYVQGINDLVTPFFVVFLQSHIGPNIEDYPIETIDKNVLLTIEADSYWCMSKLLDGIQDHYTFAQPGLQRMIYKLQELVARIDAPLAKHLEQQEAQFIQFGFRWMNCLLMRELPLPLIIRMWDTYLSENDGFSTYHVYVCACFLKTWSKQLQQLEFQEIMLFIQHLPTTNWTVSDIEILLSDAYLHKTLYHDAPSHLKNSDPQNK